MPSAPSCRATRPWSPRSLAVLGDFSAPLTRASLPAPCRPWIRDYGALERRLLLAQLQAINLRRLAIPDTVQNVAENLPRCV